MNPWVIGIFGFLFGSIACSCFQQVKLLIDIKYELIKEGEEDD